MKLDVWVASPSCLPAIASDASMEMKSRYFTYTNADMSDHGWIKVGVAEFEVALLKTGEIEAGALAAVDKAIEETKKEFSEKLKQLQDARQSLLALPAEIR